MGCGYKSPDLSKYQDDGKVKPTLALLPFVNYSDIDVSWNVSEELTQGVKNAILKSGNLYLSSQNHVEMVLEQSKNLYTPRLDLNELKKFSPSEFVVLLEVLSHKNKAYKRGSVKPVYPADGRISHVLSITAKVRVVDIREEEPKTVLHEIIHSNHLIPKPMAKIGHKDKSWGDETYNFSPLGMAHARLERDIANRLESYVLVAKSF